MDVKLLTTRQTFNQLYLLSQNIPNPAQLTTAVAQFAGLDGYASGIFWGVNSCGPGDCDPSQWSFHHMFATSYYRLTSLGLSKDWRGYLPAYTGAASTGLAAAAFDALPVSVTVAAADDGAIVVGEVRSLEAAVADAVSAVAEETVQERATREAAWNATYTFKS
jgi:hypothetical protein